MTIHSLPDNAPPALVIASLNCLVDQAQSQIQFNNTAFAAVAENLKLQREIIEGLQGQINALSRAIESLCTENDVLRAELAKRPVAVTIAPATL